jgi:RHS repeat-associated protein
MAGISCKALNGAVENKLKYNGIEQNTDFDLNMYDAFYRNLDPQIGRFWQIDPYTEDLESYSPYESMGNNPVNNVDPLGDFSTRFGAWLHKIFNGGGEVGQNKYGEWFVRKTETSNSVEGGPTVTAKVSYGKGRDRYSSAREEAVSEMNIIMDIYSHGENSMYQMYDSPQDAGKGALSIGTGVLLPDPILKNATIAANLSQLKARISKLMTAARVADKNGLSRVGRALFKHGSRSGSTFPKASGNPDAVNKQGEAVLKEILSSPDVEVVTRHHARFGNVSEYKLPNGQGARFSSDGKTFFGFIENGQ